MRKHDTKMIDTIDLVKRLQSAQIASCTCETKTPKIEIHNPQCHYRLFCEAEEVITQYRRAVERYFGLKGMIE